MKYQDKSLNNYSRQDTLDDNDNKIGMFSKIQSHDNRK